MRNIRASAQSISRGWDWYLLECLVRCLSGAWGVPIGVPARFPGVPIEVPGEVLGVPGEGRG